MAITKRIYTKDKLLKLLLDNDKDIKYPKMGYQGYIEISKYDFENIDVDFSNKFNDINFNDCSFTDCYFKNINYINFHDCNFNYCYFDDILNINVKSLSGNFVYLTNCKYINLGEDYNKYNSDYNTIPDVLKTKIKNLVICNSDNYSNIVLSDLDIEHLTCKQIDGYTLSSYLKIFKCNIKNLLSDNIYQITLHETNLK